MANTLCRFTYIGVCFLPEHTCLRAHLYFVSCTASRTHMSSHEGIMVKNLDTPYIPDDRSTKWLKLKPDYVDSMLGHMDLIVMGACCVLATWWFNTGTCSRFEHMSIGELSAMAIEVRVRKVLHWSLSRSSECWECSIPFFTKS